MQKLNKKGFALVETLIVSVFVMTIFTIIYTNFFPMMGEYERREGYDDIDNIYKTYLIKKMIESKYFTNTGKNEFTSISSSTPIKEYTSNCNQFTTDGASYCPILLKEVDSVKIYYAKYNLTELKNAIRNGNSSVSFLDSETREYIRTLPYYTNSANNPRNYTYRIIVEYKKVIDKESEKSKKRTIISFSTIGVDIS